MRVTPSAQSSLATLVAGRKTVICVGAGGVGKTTVAAGLAVAMARNGLRVLALTIDPSRRLASSLRVIADGSAPHEVVSDRLGLDPNGPGRLWVAVLDAKNTFDRLVIRYSSSDSVRDRILANRLYQQLSSYLAGTQEYMAMEKLLEMQEDERFDVIVLDTPPTQNALQFFESPDRMVDALDGAAIRWFVDGQGESARGAGQFLARRVASILRGMASVTGVGFLDQTAQLLADLNSLFGGFRQRAQRVKATLTSPHVTCVLVTRPEPLAVRDARFLSEYLRARGVHQGAWVLNRMEPELPVDPAPGEIERALQEHSLLVSEHCVPAIMAALNATRQVHKYQSTVVEEATTDFPVVTVPPLMHDADELSAVAEMSRILNCAGGRSQPPVF